MASAVDLDLVDYMEWTAGVYARQNAGIRRRLDRAHYTLTERRILRIIFKRPDCTDAEVATESVWSRPESGGLPSIARRRGETEHSQASEEDMKYEATTPRREDLADFMAFAVIAEERSFTKAASRLGVSKSALSHALRGLEDRLGVKLVHRTTRSVSPTEAGRRLADRLKPAFDDVASAVADLGDFRGDAAGRVRISTHREASVHLIMPKLRMLKERYPEVVVELAIEDYLTDIVTTGFDAGIRPGERLAKDMISVRLEPDQHFLLVGSPDYFESRPRPKKPDDLRGHACVIYRNVSSKRYFRWKFSKGSRTVHVDMEPSVIINDASLLVQGALNGLGLAYVLERQVRQHIASGALISVLDDWSVPTAGDFIYFPSDRQMSPALKVVVDALRYRDD